jgi:hypothetical protein
MKKILFTVLFAICANMLMAQYTEKFMNAMKKNLEAIDTSFRNPQSLLALANNFERIGDAEKTQWLPYYYAAFCQVNVGFMITDKTQTDAFAEKAAALIAKADALNPNNSEISCIKSMIASCHMMVDPMQRWQQYGPESSKQIAMAQQQDPTNPRPDMLTGQSLKYTPENFGGGCKTAMLQLDAAMKKFEAFKPASPFHPNWGKEMTQQMMNECK